MKNRIIIFVTLLLMCALIPLQNVLGQTISVTVKGDSAKTTTTADTDDITFTVSVSYTGGGQGIVSISKTVVGPEGNTLDPKLTAANTDEPVITGLQINSGTSKDVDITASRWAPNAGDGFKQTGTYTITFTALLQLTIPSQPVVKDPKSVTLTLTLEEAGAPTYDHITVNSVDGLTRDSTTNDVEDIAYTLRVTNVGDESDHILLSAEGDISLAYISPNNVVLEPGTYEDVMVTLPREELSYAGTYINTVQIFSTIANFAVVASIVTGTTITGDPNPTNPTDPTDPIDPTDPTNPIEPTEPDQSTHKVIISEFMFEVGGEEVGLPQWIEVYNNSTVEVNLRGWKLQWRKVKPTPMEITLTLKENFVIPSQQCRLIVSDFDRHSGGGRLENKDVYSLLALHEEELVQDDVDFTSLMNRDGFSLKLLNTEETVIDHIGTLNNDDKVWKLPPCLIKGVRSSLIRRFDMEIPRTGIQRRGWIASNVVQRLTLGLYYGHRTDLGTPGYRQGKPLPVELSHFSARLVEDKIVINWTTESELNNAGFNIYRSTARTGNFRLINTKLIKGAGTTGEKSTYQFIDTTAKLNVSYYYRIEDIDFGGKRERLATRPVRGVFSPTNKVITRWSSLKSTK